MRVRVRARVRGLGLGLGFEGFEAHRGEGGVEVDPLHAAVGAA